MERRVSSLCSLKVNKAFSVVKITISAVFSDFLVIEIDKTGEKKKNWDTFLSIFTVFS